MGCGGVDSGWVYAPRQEVKDFVSGGVRDQPFNARVFGLPKTHVIEHAAADSEEQVDFHVWVLSFFLGVRLTTTDAGFLDATPVKGGKLVDFTLLGRNISRVFELAEEFWECNRDEPRNARRYVAAVHALYLGQSPQSLEFERFVYLYTAIDACYALARSLRNESGYHRHAGRLAWTCGEFGVQVPVWAKRSARGDIEVATVRNDTLHEALFMDAPLGFAVHREGSSIDLTLEMSAVVCRLLVALIGVGNDTYVGSTTDSRQRFGLELGECR